MPQLMNREVKSCKQTVLFLEHCAVSKVLTSVRSAVFQPRHRSTIVLLLVYCPVIIIIIIVDNMLFEISPEIRCSGVSK